MKCPNCEESRLEGHALEENLLSLACNACGGHWIQSFQYWKWLKSHGGNLPEKPADESAKLSVRDGNCARICPECNRILTRCKVGHGLDFYLDRCGHCGGLWFDRNEWEVLKNRNLHDDSHFIFSKSWQDRLMRDEQAAFHEAWLVEKVGSGRFAELLQVKAWLQSHEHRAAILRFLGQ